MIRERAVKAISEILNSAGYEAGEGNEQIDLSAYTDDDCIVVLCSDDKDRINNFNNKIFRIELESGKTECKKIIFTMNPNVHADNCIIWSYQELAKYSGQAVVAYVLDEKLALKLQTDVKKTGYTPYSSGSEKSDEYAPELPLLPSRISDEKARRIAGIKGTLKKLYIPHYLYECRSSGEKRYKSYIIDFNAEVFGLVNAVSGKKALIEDEELNFSVVEEKRIPESAEIIQPHVNKKEITEGIKQDFVEELTKSVRVSTTEGDTIYYEDKEVKPDEETVSTEIMLVYLPVIQIRGDKVVEINAFTGEFLEEPMDDGVELF
ncbi:hypothetical protein [Methanoplanus endosymbiosus]|uniref:Uncharacterized protein n=1 Tax=Methanoplanus endosymbiosus TaxID=33865 RepID=A0A9E7TJ37_9EURY|nr:hypothetical protein [Methanoplanus endosymbiosus]UUX91484.1 hypothetical protein L6E24_08865 [Methanoplanus endosymbiosus]